MTRMLAAVRDSRYFTCSTLQVIGFGHGAMDESCEVWVLHGCDTPVLLRQKNVLRYEFCGIATVRGRPDTNGDIMRINLV